MDRRTMMMTSAGVMLSSAAAAQQSPPLTHHQVNTALLDSALRCVKTGDLCQAHCVDLLAQKDTTMADCARSVTALVSVCGTLAVLVAQNAPLLPRYAAVAHDACKSCEDECRKHAEKHQVCKDCADACAACAAECAKVT